MSLEKLIKVFLSFLPVFKLLFVVVDLVKTAYLPKNGNFLILFTEVIENWQ